MPVKVFNVSVELDVQAVTCPGVWLCPNGKIFLKLFMFGSSARTSCLSPVFPLVYYQKFIFEKTFSNARYLTDLQDFLGKEFLCAELIQYSGDCVTILASFKTTVFELLYPSPCMKGLIAGVDVDLLMEPTRWFPGILAPKIHLSTQTTIDEVVDSSPPHKRNPGLINPKMLSSKYSPPSKRRHQRRVCYGKDEGYRSPKLRKKPLHSKMLHSKRNHPSFVVVPNTDNAIHTWDLCQVETTGINPLHLQSAETSQGSSTQLPMWTSASGRIYSPCSYYNTFKESALEEDQTKQRETRKGG